MTPMKARLAANDEEITQTQGEIKTWTDILEGEQDDYGVDLFKSKLSNCSHKRHKLVAEKEMLLADLAASGLSGADREAIKAAAKDIKMRIEDPTFEQKRALFDMLDVRVELEWREENRGILVTCGLRLTEEGKRIPTWQRLSSPHSGIGGESSSTMTLLRRMISSSSPWYGFSSLTPIEQSSSPGRHIHLEQLWWLCSRSPTRETRWVAPISPLALRVIPSCLLSSRTEFRAGYPRR